MRHATATGESKMTSTRMEKGHYRVTVDGFLGMTFDLRHRRHPGYFGLVWVLTEPDHTETIHETKAEAMEELATLEWA